MNDERYQGRCRGIIIRKTESVEYAERMVEHFVKARGNGGALTKYAYCTLFANSELPTSKGKLVWHITMITNLMKIDQTLIAGREKAAAEFQKGKGYLTSPKRAKERRLSDQGWIDLEAEYLGGLDRLVERAKIAAAKIRGDVVEGQGCRCPL